MPVWVIVAGLPLQQTIAQGRLAFLLYGEDGSTTRVLVSVDMPRQRVRYALDLDALARPAASSPGEPGPLDAMREVTEWCADQFDPSRWLQWRTATLFFDHVEATAFKLRWL